VLACLTLPAAGGSYLAHITSKTGAAVQLRGRGSTLMEGPDPLHVYIVPPPAPGATAEALGGLAKQMHEAQTCVFGCFFVFACSLFFRLWGETGG
jgi:hypothetical protein